VHLGHIRTSSGRASGVTSLTSQGVAWSWADHLALDALVTVGESMVEPVPTGR
jgi:hypothetical protein